MDATAEQIQLAILNILFNEKGLQLGRVAESQGYFVTMINSVLGESLRGPPRAANQALWSLIRQGLVFINFSEGSTDRWTVLPTDAGLMAMEEESSGPDNPDFLHAQLMRKVPEASNVVMQYAKEATIAYRNMCNLASMVMIGVASEAAFLEMAQAFSKWLPPSSSEGKKFAKELNNPKTQIKSVFDTFVVAFESNKDDIPFKLKNGIERDFHSIFTMIRVFRNDAGHPTEATIDREDVATSLRVLPRYLRRIYDLKDFFLSGHYP